MKKARTVVFATLGAVGIATLLAGSALAGAAHTAGAQTFTVNVDGKNPKVNEAFLAYYPSTVRIHAGDTVVFHEVGNGEPHTVTLGSLANAAVAAFDKLTPKQQQGQPPKSAVKLDAKVPQLLPQGPGDAVQSGANPCFVQSGEPPAKRACPKSAQPDFTGKESFYNSGWLASNARFSVHLSSSVAPGTYRFMCLLHREGMTGKVVVVPSSSSVPSPAAQFASGQKALSAVEAKLASAAKALAQGKPPLPVPLPGQHPALAGSASQNAQEAEITQFGPRKVHVPVGGTVTWYILGPHSLTFNSTKSDDDIRSVAPDGSVHVNPKALAPANAPGEPPPKGSQNANGPPKFRVVAHKTWNGEGFLNTGVFTNSFGPPLIEGYAITFTHAGKYKYLCTVHDDMTGEVDVG